MTEIRDMLVGCSALVGVIVKKGYGGPEQSSHDPHIQTGFTNIDNDCQSKPKKTTLRVPKGERLL